VIERERGRDEGERKKEGKIYFKIRGILFIMLSSAPSYESKEMSRKTEKEKTHFCLSFIL